MESKIIKHPKIGSGKITRRVFIIYRSKGKNHSGKLIQTKDHELFRKKQLPIVSPTFHKPKKRIKFQNDVIKLIFIQWNRFGHPFVQHKNVWNKTTARAVDRIDKSTKHHTKQEILKSMDRVYKLFGMDWFKYRLYFAKVKLTLPEFFYYDARRLRKARIKIKDCPRSWLEEGFKGFDYLEHTYSAVPKDKNPSISSKIEDHWIEYHGGKRTNRVKSGSIKISKLVKKFSKINNFDPQAIVDVIGGMLNGWKSFKPKHIGYLQTDIFWNEQLPKELERYGLVNDRCQLKEIE